MTNYERQKIRRRNGLERKAISIFRRALKKQIEPIFQYVGNIPSAQLDDIIDSVVIEEPMKAAFIDVYGRAGRIFAPMVIKRAQQSTKSAETVFTENVFDTLMQEYALTEAGFKITSITATTKKLLQDATQKSLNLGFQNGWGIETIQKDLIKRYKGTITPARAKAIAQTETIAASNAASFKAAESTGINWKKSWSTSGLANTRDTHLRAEADSIDGIKPEEKFSNGLLYPGDSMNGSAGEVINCRCTLMEFF